MAIFIKFKDSSMSFLDESDALLFNADDFHFSSFFSVDLEASKLLFFYNILTYNFVIKINIFIINI